MQDYSVVDEETNENDILINIELEKKCKCKRKYIVTIMLSLIIFVIISILYVNYSIDIRIYDVESTDVEAHFHSGIHHYHHITCKDLDYGCCSIIDNLNHNISSLNLVPLAQREVQVGLFSRVSLALLIFGCAIVLSINPLSGIRHSGKSLKFFKKPLRYNS